MAFTYTVSRDKGAGKRATGAARMKTQRDLYRDQVKTLKQEVRGLKERLATYAVYTPPVKERNMDADDTDTEFDAGVKAYEAGVGLLDNPHPFGSPEHSHWRQGWTSAQRDSK